MPIPVLTPRALNRALLARQLLIERSDHSATDAIALLVGLQAQAPLAPYVGLWSRLRGFQPADLVEPLEGRVVVRATLMRGTVHLVTGDDALQLRPLMEAAIARGFNAGFSRQLAAEEAEQVITLGRELLEEAPRTRAELRDVFRRHWPDRDANAMAYAVSYLLPTMQPTPRGVWGTRARAELTLMTSWLDRPLDVAPSIDQVVLRYLRVFGPASVKDVQTWSGLTGLKEVVERLSGQLEPFLSIDGQELHDLPDAPRPDPDTPVPPRLLPEYDNVLFSHHERGRIIDHRRPVPLPAGLGARTGTFLLDGYFRGTWKLENNTLLVFPFEIVGEQAAADLIREGERLASFLGVSGASLRPPP
jgi:hypothetical protein